MIKLYGFGQSFSVVDPSPFVVKVDAFLRMAKLDFETVVSSSNLKKAPKSKLPFIDDDSERIADSEFIIDHLMNKYQLTINDFLTDDQQAQVYLLTKSLDENFYWCLVYSRWVLKDTWPMVSKTFFSGLPWPLKLFVPSIVQKSVLKNLNGQGLGRHSESDILAIQDKTLSALSQLLSDKAYFFGDKACSFDASAYAFLSSFISVDFDNVFNVQARKYEKLVSYCLRFEKEYY